ncbi:MAG: hypothetical protein LBU51_10680 [Bacteroidales bacterium]|nr:hypothetical protein [Bacteroidales bacterium]
MRYILDNPRKFNAYIFGNSRISAIDVDTIDSLHCYNMWYPGGHPLEHFENIEIMINHNIIPDTILLGIDDIAFAVDPEVNRTQLMLMPYPKDSIQIIAHTKFLIKYLNPSVLSSIKTILFHKTDAQNLELVKKLFYENGGRSRMKDEQSSYNWKEAKLINDWQYNYGIENAITDIQKIIDLCNKNNIKLIIFTNPLYILTYQNAVQNGYIDFLTRLSHITDYYNFSGINDITINNDYYLEPSHYKFNIGDMMINTIFNGINNEKLLAQGFGYHITKENRDTFLDLLHEQLTD